MSDSKSDEPTFSILPHPASDNTKPETADDIEQRHGGLGGAPNLQHLQKAAQDATGGSFGLAISLCSPLTPLCCPSGKGPHIPSQEIANSLEQPKSREELQVSNLAPRVE